MCIFLFPDFRVGIGFCFDFGLNCDFGFVVMMGGWCMGVTSFVGLCALHGWFGLNCAGCVGISCNCVY